MYIFINLKHVWKNYMLSKVLFEAVNKKKNSTKLKITAKQRV